MSGARNVQGGLILLSGDSRRTRDVVLRLQPMVPCRRAWCTTTTCPRRLIRLAAHRGRHAALIQCRRRTLGRSREIVPSRSRSRELALAAGRHHLLPCALAVEAVVPTRLCFTCPRSGCRFCAGLFVLTSARIAEHHHPEAHHATAERDGAEDHEIRRRPLQAAPGDA